ncbi:MAG: GTPase, partial [Enterococcus faecalis]|nr:GTPase [Enterococcus faecalis]
MFKSKIKSEKSKKNINELTKEVPEEVIEDPEFRSFFQDVLKKFPQKTSTAIMNA